MFDEANWPYVVGLVSILIYIFFLTFISVFRGWKERKFEFGFGDAVVSLVPAMLWFISSGTVEKLVLSATGVEYQRANKAIQKTLELSIVDLSRKHSAKYATDFIELANFKSDSSIFISKNPDGLVSDEFSLSETDEYTKRDDYINKIFPSSNFPDKLIFDISKNYSPDFIENIISYGSQFKSEDNGSIIFSDMSGKFLAECGYGFLFNNYDKDGNVDYSANKKESEQIADKFKSPAEFVNFVKQIGEKINNDNDTPGYCETIDDTISVDSNLLQAIKIFDKNDSDLITVLDKQGQYYGVLDRDDATNKLLTELILVFQK